MNWRLRNEDGTLLPMFQGSAEQGVLLFDDSEEDDDEEGDEDDDSYLYYLAKGSGLIHYENQQFLVVEPASSSPWNMENVMYDLRRCELIP